MERNASFQMIRLRKKTVASVSSAAVFIGCLVVSLPAIAMFSDDEARRAILDLRARVEALNTRIDDLQKQLQNSAQGQLQLLNENERLRADLALLRGQLEETGRLATTGKSQQKGLYLDLDQRLKQLEPVTVEANGITYRVSTPEKTRYDELQEALKSGDVKKTVSLANRFTLQFPGSSLGPRVLMTKGTALYADKNYKAAIAARESFIDRYPGHPEIPQAMLNLAASQAESGNTSAARTTLQAVIKDYADSPAASDAKERLKTLAKPAAPAPSKAPPTKSPPAK